MGLRGVVVLASSLLFLSGCAIPTSYLENDAGQQVKCQWVGIGVIGVPASMLGDALCVAKYQKQGYHVIDAPGAVPGAGGTTPTASASESQQGTNQKGPLRIPKRTSEISGGMEKGQCRR
jgi:hypothetical protein